jgi:hypothetical protein
MLNGISLVHQVHLCQFHLVSLCFHVPFVKFRIGYGRVWDIPVALAFQCDSFSSWTPRGSYELI